MSIESMMPSNHLIPRHPLLLLSSIFPSIRQGLFRWVSSSHQVPKVLELQLQHHSPSNEYSGLISFRVNWFDLLAVQGTLKTVSQTRKLHSHGKGTRRSREPWWRGHYDSRWWPHKLWRQLFQSRFCSSFMASVSQLVEPRVCWRSSTRIQVGLGLFICIWTPQPWGRLYWAQAENGISPSCLIKGTV